MHNQNADGLRGFAALGVVIAHFIAAYLPSLLHYNYPSVFEQNPNPSTLFNILQFPLFSLAYNGHLPVIIFFVLSGYVLTIPAYNNKTDILKNRLWGRYLRLNIPILFSLILAYILLKLDLFYNVPASGLSGSKSWLYTFYKNQISLEELISTIFYKSIILGDYYLNSPLWTINIEFIGSMYLLTFYLVKSNNNLKKDIILMLLIFMFLYILYNKSSIYFYAMFIGSLLNNIKIFDRKKMLVILVFGIYFGAFQYNEYYDYLPSISINNYEIFVKKDFYNTLSAILIVAVVINGMGRRIFSSKLGNYLGRISYSMYLLHFIILCSLSSFIYLSLPISEFYLLINFIGYLTTVILLSYFYMKYIDNFSIFISHKFSNYFFKKV